MLDIANDVAGPKLSVPVELEEALDHAWLQRALAPVSGGKPVTSVETTDRFETMAAKVRFKVRFGDDPDERHFCLKAFLGDRLRGAGTTAVREAEFYVRIAPNITARVPWALSIIDREANRAVLIMNDMIHAGDHFCSALEPFTAEDAAGTLEQIARLHAGSHLLADNPWIPNRLDFIVDEPYLSDETLQGLMNDPRSARLNERTSDAGLLRKAMAALRDRFRGRDTTILHGDCHAGNFYRTADGLPGITDWQLIQRGCWAQDVAYHIAAVLPVEIAEREEERLVRGYLEVVRSLGAPALDFAAAWEDYRAAQVYGYYHWAITRMVDPAITHTFCHRLGAGIERHDTYRLLGI